MPDQYTPYQTDNDGNIIDPPVIQDYERQIREASAAGDEDQIALATEDYHTARERIAERHNNRVDERKREDQRLLAEDRQRQDRERSDAADREKADAERQNIERLRALDASRASNPDAEPDDPAPSDAPPTGGLADAGSPTTKDDAP